VFKTLGIAGITLDELVSPPQRRREFRIGDDVEYSPWCLALVDIVSSGPVGRRGPFALGPLLGRSTEILLLFTGRTSCSFSSSLGRSRFMEDVVVEDIDICSNGRVETVMFRSEGFGEVMVDLSNDRDLTDISGSELIDELVASVDGVSIQSRPVIGLFKLFNLPDKGT
jgi:hypothetical protein